MSDASGGGGAAGPAQVVLWRHGRTAWNADGRWQGHTDVPLDERGSEQVAAAAAVLAARGPVRVVSSDLSRASATAGALALAADLPVALDPRLREVFGGDWQGLRRAEIAAGWPELHAAWLAGDDVPPGGGERRTEAGARVLAAVEEHAAPLGDGEVLVVVGHGGALGAALLQLLGLPAAAAPVLTGLRNARWSTLLRGAPGAAPWRLLEHNAGAWSHA
ncbi:histidine phosphatase family protein [uncultured Pseudokineococcus sp.]|uniref:histidine phosphatase family protein n=1 Tax=uncultured Pseudokineococcus sp. TaxID=1642928 RepID=UPI002632CFA2|nr:histidine phosphatase family protein [uncultured Pseudokineococcus sp.]